MRDCADTKTSITYGQTDINGASPYEIAYWFSNQPFPDPKGDTIDLETRAFFKVIGFHRPCVPRFQFYQPVFDFQLLVVRALLECYCVRNDRATLDRYEELTRP